MKEQETWRERLQSPISQYEIGNDDDNDNNDLIKYQFELPVRLPFAILCLSL